MELEQYNTMSYGSQFNMNCTNFTEHDWTSLNLVRSIAATLGAVIILVILSFLICYKAYSSLFQRLYLYLIIVTLLNEMTGIVSIEHQWQYEGQETVCKWVGFFLAWTYVLVFIFSYEIIFYLLYLVTSKIWGTRLPLWCSRIGSRCCGAGVAVEAIFVVLPVLISTAFALPPLLAKPQRYGIAGPWCFVRSLNDNCDPAGFTIQVAFYGMYMFVGVVGIAASLIFSVVYFKLATSFREARHLLKRTLYIMVYKFIHILLIMCSLTCRLYTLLHRRHQLYGLWLVHALAVPIGVLVFPLGYLLCFYPVRRIAQNIYETVGFKCCRCRRSVRLFEAQDYTIQATYGTLDHTS